MRIIAVREEVIALGWPLCLGLVQCLDVAGRCRVEHVNASILLIGILDHFIHVFEPHIAAHIVEVVAHGEHNLICIELACLFFCVADQFVHLYPISN